MRFLKDVQKVAGILFYTLGVFLFAAFLFWKNDFFVYETEVFLRYADLPFAFLALLYGGVSLRISLAGSLREENTPPEESDDDAGEQPVIDAVLIVIGCLIFFGFVYFDFAFPNIL
ncbi:hypothetical protein HZA38_00700 [Candidatus Peregrinibacteria bacterium]|nr:hypothetical protein [Candidatus Peregrinibacteria bacterium]